MPIPQSPSDGAQLLQMLEEIRQEGQVRHDRALLLGYYEAAGLGDGIAGARSGAEMLFSAEARDSADPTFHIWRLDQPSDTAKIFRTVAEVDEYLINVATFPRYRLKLNGNPRLVIEDGERIRVTDKLSGEHFAVLRADLETFKNHSTGASVIWVYAEAAPTVGDWVQE